MGRVSYCAEEQLRAPFVASEDINDISVKGGFMGGRGLRREPGFISALGCASLGVEQSTFLHISLR